MKLMDSEKKRMEKKETTQAHARLMTSKENLDALAEKDFRKHWKEVVKELTPIFKQIRDEIDKKNKIWMNPEYLALDDQKAKDAGH